MKTYPDCYSCFLNQAVRTAYNLSENKGFHQEIARLAAQLLVDLDMDRTPPETGAEIEALIFKKLSLSDPYAELRSYYNELMMGLAPRFTAQIQGSGDPFGTAMRLAIGGNIIDFGNEYTMSEALAHETLERSLTDPVMPCDSKDVERVAGAARSVLYIGDNCGEIVLDRLFIELIGPEKVTFAVRGGPILNDITMMDARQTGMTDVVRVVQTGQALPGVLPETASEQFRRAWEKSDLVIAKGQGNYETLSETKKPVVFLLKAKCTVVAKHLGVPQGSMIAKLVNL